MATKFVVTLKSGETCAAAGDGMAILPDGTLAIVSDVSPGVGAITAVFRDFSFAHKEEGIEETGSASLLGSYNIWFKDAQERTTSSISRYWTELAFDAGAKWGREHP